MHKIGSVKKVHELVDALDSGLKDVATYFARQFQKDHGYVSFGNELQIFMAKYDAAIAEAVDAITEQTMQNARTSGVLYGGLLVDAVRNAKTVTVSYLWRQIASLRPSSVIAG